MERDKGDHRRPGRSGLGTDVREAPVVFLASWFTSFCTSQWRVWAPWMPSPFHHNPDATMAAAWLELVVSFLVIGPLGPRSFSDWRVLCDRSSACVEGRLDAHEQCPRDVFSVPGLLGVADESSHRIDARSTSPAPVLAFMELPSSFQLVRYEVGSRFFLQLVSGAQECDHPVGTRLALIRLSLLWYDDSFGTI